MSSIQYRFSRPFANSEAESYGCFTSLPIRVSLYQDIANKASEELQENWERHAQRDHGRRYVGCCNPVGHFVSLVAPEALPDRVDVVAYLSEFAYLYDGKKVR
jgi:ophiobolin F synthase